MYQEQKNIKVDTYDFFGYLIPGFVLFLAILFAHYYLQSPDENKGFINSTYKIFEFITAAQSFLLLLFTIIISYILGHVTASTSSFLLDKIVIGKILGYPYQHIIFDDSIIKDSNSDACRIIISGLYLSALIFILLPTQKFKFTIGEDNNFHIYPWIACLTLYLAYLVLYIIKNGNFSDRTVFILKSYTPLFIFYTMFLLVEKISKIFIGLQRTFPKEVVTLIKSKYKTCLGIELHRDLGSEIFWTMYWHVSSKDPFVRSKIDKWLILYSFMRNLSCSCFISAIIIVIPEFYHSTIFRGCFLHSIVLLIFSVIFALRYYYLYFCYYSKNTFRAFVYIDYDSNQSKDAENP